MQNILYITQSQNLYVVQAWHLFQQALAEAAHVVVWRQGGSIQSILAQLSFQPDFILLHMPSFARTPHVTGLRGIAIPIGVYFEDIHQCPAYFSRFVRANNIGTVFCPYRHQFHKFLPDLVDRFYWLPHCVDPGIFRDYKLGKSIELLLMGFVHQQAYPFRAAVLSRFTGQPGFVYHAHPGYIDCDANDPQAYVGVKYAQELSRAKILATCGGRWHYPVLKFFEASACLTSVLAPAGPDLPDLGFRDGDTYIECSIDDLAEKVAYFIGHEAETAAIASRARDLVVQRHSVQKRVQELVAYLGH